MAEAVDPYAMDIVNEINREYDAFVPMDIDAKIVSPMYIRLHRIPLNTSIYKGTIPFTQKLLDEIDSMCCKAFGNKTGITIQNDFAFYPIAETGILPGSVVDKEQKAELLLLCGKGTTIIMMAIVVFCTSEEGESVIDIWTVAKNPKINYKNAFERFLKEIKNLGEKYSTVGIFALEVKRENTIQMTEQGRLRLYSSLGFSILSKTPVEMIYPPKQTEVVLHDTVSPGRLVLYKENKSTMVVENDYEVFLGNIKSIEGKAIPMRALRDSMGIPRDIYLGHASSFKGETALLYDEDYNVEDVALNIKKNGKVPVDEFQKNDTLVPIRCSYHMGIGMGNEGVPFPNTYVNTFQVPDDFIIVSFTSPGSILYTSYYEQKYLTETLSEKFMENIDTFNRFIELNKSTANFPIYNIQSHSTLESIFRSNNTTKQLNGTLMNSILVDSLGRQPIYEFQIDSPKTQYKKYQIDLQIYTGGMYMINNTLSRETNDALYSGGRSPVNKKQATIDSTIMNLGTFNVISKERYDDTPFVNNQTLIPENTISAYLQHMKSILPLQGNNAGKQKYLVFLFGCSALDTQEQYETLYELSHRRSIVHVFPKKSDMTSEIFINNILYNKFTNPYEEKCRLPSRAKWPRATNRVRAVALPIRQNLAKRGTAFRRLLQEASRRNRKIRINLSKHGLSRRHPQTLKKKKEGKSKTTTFKNKEKNSI